jgi:hypothetical protein
METKRVTLALPERTVERLEALKDLTASTSVTDVVKQAIMTYESIARHLASGVTFYAQKPNGERIAVEFMIDVPQYTRNISLVTAS